MKHLLTSATLNRFQVSADTTEDEFEIRLAGNSMVLCHLVESCGRSSNGNRKHYCYLDASLYDIITACENVRKNAVRNTFFVINAGTNGVMTTDSEELLEILPLMIKQCRRKVNASNTIISGKLQMVGTEFSFM